MALFLDHRNRVEPYAEVVPMLQALGAEYRLVSVTNGNSDVERTPLRGLFHHSLTAAQVGAQKPDPALFRGALAWARVPPGRALHLGDDPFRDVEAARRFGMRAVWVNRGGGGWPDELDPPAAEVPDLIGVKRWLEDRDHAF
jgi:putative hydrolase of the HAD superfamily